MRKKTSKISKTINLFQADLDNELLELVIFTFKRNPFAPHKKGLVAEIRKYGIKIWWQPLSYSPQMYLIKMHLHTGGVNAKRFDISYKSPEHALRDGLENQDIVYCSQICRSGLQERLHFVINRTIAVIGNAKMHQKRKEKDEEK
jgi:hypothetical protein